MPYRPAKSKHHHLQRRRHILQRRSAPNPGHRHATGLPYWCALHERSDCRSSAPSRTHSHRTYCLLSTVDSLSNLVCLASSPLFPPPSLPLPRSAWHRLDVTLLSISTRIRQYELEVGEFLARSPVSRASRRRRSYLKHETGEFLSQALLEEHEASYAPRPNVSAV